MENHNKLARPQNVNSAIEKSYSALSLTVLIRMLDRAASMTGKEFTEAESQLWKAQFSKYPPQVIQAAFDAHAMQSEFFPKPKEIADLIAQQSQKDKLDDSAAMMEENRRTRERLAAEGLPSGSAQFAGLMKKCLEKVKTMPEIDQNRRKELKSKIAELRKQKVG